MSAPQFYRTQERVRKELFAEIVQSFPKPKKRGGGGRRTSTPASYYMDMTMLKELTDLQAANKKKNPT